MVRDLNLTCVARAESGESGDGLQIPEVCVDLYDRSLGAYASRMRRLNIKKRF